MNDSSSDLLTSLPAAREGQACIRLPQGVFYNRVQEFNRDLTVSVIQHFQKIHLMEWLSKTKDRISVSTGIEPQYEGIRIFDALSATGIRSVRFALEIPCVSSVVANDLDVNSTQLIKENVSLNGVEAHVEVSCADAIDVMHRSKEFSKKFNVVDIDPFGTASPFLDSAVSCLHNGGLLCVTSTDMAVLCGSTPGTAMGKYGGFTVKHSLAHEMGLRMLLNAIQSAASRYGLVMEPLVSLSVDFYARVFVRIWRSAATVKTIATKHGICFCCVGCTAYHIQPLGTLGCASKPVVPARGPPVGPTCPECGSAFTVSGPVWIGPLHSQQFLQSLLTNLQFPPNAVIPTPSTSEHCKDPSQRAYPCNFTDHLSLPDGYSLRPGLTMPVETKPISERFGTYKRIVGMLTVAYEELPDVVLGYKVDHLAAVLGSLLPPQGELHSAFLNAGYRVSCSHTDPNSFKTDAPMSFIWDVFVTYHKLIASQTKAPATECKSTVSEEEITSSSDEDSSQIPERKRRKKRFHSRNPSPNRLATVSLRRQARDVLLNRQITHPVDFSIHSLAIPASRQSGLLRFQVKPEKYWGPKARPRMTLAVEHKT